MRSVAIAALLLSIGCAEKAVEVRLNWPDVGSDIANMDVSCVNSVHIIVQGEVFEDYNYDCIEVTNPTSYEDLQAQIRGKLDIELPDDTIAVQVRGQALATPGADFCGTGMNVFYAGGEYTGGDLTLNVEGVIDCSAIKSTGTLKVRPVDFVALANTPAGAATPVCETSTLLADSDEGVPPSLVIGAIRPTNITLPDFDTSLFDYAALPGALFGYPIDADGTASVATMGAALPTSCLAVGDLVSYGISCIYPGAPSVCAMSGEVEMPFISTADAGSSLDGTLYDEFPSLVHGLVYDTVLKKPVAGATVSLGEGRGAVVYATPSGAQFTPIAGAVTDASGAFLAYMKEPSVITVTQGASTKAMRIGGVYFGGSAVIVPLR